VDITNIIGTKYNKHISHQIHKYINTITHENKGNGFLINECNEPTEDGTSMLHSTVEWLSQKYL